MEEMIKKAIAAGFSEASGLDTATLEARADVRQACAENKCGKFGKNWACPPACGQLEECAARLRSYSKGIIAVTVGELEDSFDFEGITRTGDEHRENIKRLAGQLSREGADFLALGAGMCPWCPECSYPEPCRFPEKRIMSMESHGLLVGDVCKKNGAVYYHGPCKQAFFACFLFR